MSDAADTLDALETSDHRAASNLSPDARHTPAGLVLR